jgi:hypothetical protein
MKITIMRDLTSEEREEIGPAGSASEQILITPPPASRLSDRLLTAENIKLLVQVLAVFALFAGLLAIIQFGSDAFVGTDGYYHARMALLIRQEGLRPEFEALPLTILNVDDFYNHHLLYHVYLSLFAGTDPIVDGGLALARSIKLASVIMPALAFLAVWWMLRCQEVPWATLWALGLFAVSEAFLYRMSMPRVQSASLLVLVLGLHWMLVGKYRPLILLGFAYVWLFDGFLLLPILGFIYLGAKLLLDRELAWQAVVFPVIGIGLGLLINPYFPENIDFTLNHLLPKIMFSDTRVGTEWYPYETWTLVENSGFSLVALLLAALALGWQKERINLPTSTLLLLTALFGLLLFKSRRFVEYFPAFVLMFTALTVSPLIKERLVARSRFYKISPIIFLAILAVPLAVNVFLARRSVSWSTTADQYAEAALWLARNEPEGSFVFQTDWDDFPRLFFYNPNMRYTIGLDPTYMEIQNADLFDYWEDLTQGDVEETGQAIKEQFGAQFVFTDLNHEAFLQQAAEDPWLTEIYRDEQAVIFAVNDE